MHEQHILFRTGAHIRIGIDKKSMEIDRKPENGRISIFFIIYSKLSKMLKIRQKFENVHACLCF